ncbi:hypothetical protein E5P48_21090, partial [Escherichia coli]
YIRASGWKKSPDVEDYQERPANGWDIRAEGYLPQPPDEWLQALDILGGGALSYIKVFPFLRKRKSGNPRFF